MPSAGIDWLSPSRTLRNLFGRYGITGGSIRGLYNAVMPVVVVDRYRDDTEGSQFAITATSLNVPAGRLPAFAFGSPDDDWELHGANFGTYDWQAAVVSRSTNCMIYTPDFTYVPVQTPSPAGFSQPGLNTNFPFTVSSVSGVAGHNAAAPWPARFGFFPFESRLTSAARPLHSFDDYQNPAVTFDPPIRVYRDVTLGFLVVEPVLKIRDVSVSIRYTVRPRTTPGPRTG